MQAYHGRQPIGPYISQPPYGPPQATYYTQYTPYGPYAPLGPSQPVPFPGGYAPEGYDGRPPPQAAPQPQPPRTRQRPSLRQTSQKGTKELKGILKQPRETREATSSVGHGDPTLSRSRTNSYSRQRANSSTRPQLDAHPPFAPEHLFVALDNSGELRIEGIAYQQTIDELREHVLPMWPHGVVVEESRDHRWRVQFANRPWTSSGQAGLFARRMLNQLFLVLHRGGYSYLSTVNTSGAPSRLLFSAGEPPEQELYFFNICFSKSGDKISILDAPPLLVQHLGRSLRSVFPNKVESDTYKEGNVYTILMKRSLGGSDVDKTLLAAYVLKFWKEMGYEMDGSLPLGRKLSFGVQKEVWMFRGAIPRPASSHSHR